MRSRLIIAAYDVTNPRRLTRARKTVTGWAHGGQKSVLECWLRSTETSRVFDAMRVIVDPRTDKIGIFFVGRGERALVLGRALSPADPPAFIIT